MLLFEWWLVFTFSFFFSFQTTAGRLSIPFESAYCISKYGVEALSDGIRRELSPWGVQVSMIEPGGHQTGIFNEKAFAKTMHNLWNNLSKELKDDYGEQYRDRGNNNEDAMLVFHGFSNTWNNTRLACLAGSFVGVWWPKTKTIGEAATHRHWFSSSCFSLRFRRGPPNPNETASYVGLHPLPFPSPSILRLFQVLWCCYSVRNNFIFIYFQLSTR